uniref:Uncharacterized protein n=1 Tax=Romanomermis culicivorax TaxID=13658 RepID=A0A915IE73_ROMCU
SYVQLTNCFSSKSCFLGEKICKEEQFLALPPYAENFAFGNLLDIMSKIFEIEVKKDIVL